MADIELPSLIQQRLLDVLLHDKGAICAICVSLPGLQAIFYLVQSRTNCDASSSIGEFTWFDDPYVSELFVAFAFLVLPLELLQKMYELRILDSLRDVEGNWDLSVKIFFG